MRIIAHLDMDSFFAAIEERDNPRFSGLPIVVGADPKNGLGRGVVSTANYEARKYGIHSAMPISTAWRLAPKAIFLPVNMPRYHEVSQHIMQILRHYVRYDPGSLLPKLDPGSATHDVVFVEQTSIDEAYLDLSFILHTNTSDRLYMGETVQTNEELIKKSYEKVAIIIERLKEEIRQKEKLTASVGIAPNKLIAKMASARFKPDGLTIIAPDQVQQFLDPLPIGDLPGVGPKTEEKLHRLNIRYIRELRNLAPEKLVSIFGKWGEDMYRKAQGIDDSPLELARLVKSISEQETFEKDTLAAIFLLEHLSSIAKRVLERMLDGQILGFKTVTVTVRFADFETKSRSHSLTQFTDNFNTLQKEAFKLFLPFLDRRENPRGKLIRLLGVGIENFSRT